MTTAILNLYDEIGYPLTVQIETTAAQEPHRLFIIMELGGLWPCCRGRKKTLYGDELQSQSPLTKSSGLPRK